MIAPKHGAKQHAAPGSRTGASWIRLVTNLLHASGTPTKKENAEGFEMRLQTYGSREEWLNGRRGRIGGSDAAATVGASPYMTNVELWEIKTGRRQQADISENPLVIYGTEAEDHLRELFRLDFPDYEVFYLENNLWINDKFPFAHASLDGWLKDGQGRNGILEIKTATITSAVQRAKWKDGIPQNYYCQVLWYMMVTEFDFAVLKAQLKYDFHGDVFLQTKHYFIERSEVEEDIEFLRQAAEKFWTYVQQDKRPPLILPEI